MAAAGRGVLAWNSWRAKSSRAWQPWTTRDDAQQRVVFVRKSVVRLFGGRCIRKQSEISSALEPEAFADGMAIDPQCSASHGAW